MNKNDCHYALAHAIEVLHKIQLPDYVLKNDVGHAYNELHKRMKWAKEAEKKIEETTGLSFYELGMVMETPISQEPKA